jgi:hypothetical protein
MNKHIMTRLGWGVFFFVALLFLAFQIIPHALGQRDAGKRSITGNVNRPQALTAKEAGGTQSKHDAFNDVLSAPLDALWYNGDFDGEATGNGLTNEQDTFASGFSHIYDDFNVNDSGGWDITSVFSNDFLSSNITSATWEIRQGMSAFNGGTLVASGSTDAPVITPTGRFGFGFTEFTVEVTGLSVHLDPGTYWLNVTPVDNLDGGRGFNTTTLGANCVGTPCGNDQTAFLDSSLFGAVFEPTLDFCSQCGDFSMGVNGTVSGGGGGNLKLRAGAHILDGTKVVRLHWTGAKSDTVDIFRNDELLATVGNTGSFADVLTERNIYVYKVCEAGTDTCSNEVTVKFRGP